MAPSVTETRLFDRYLLPKVALTFISIASMVGVYLTMSTHGAPAAWALVRWIHLAALGVLAGGTMWWGFFVRRPSEAGDEPPVGRLILAGARRYRIIALVALALVVLTASHLVWFHGWSETAPSRLLTAASALALGLATAACLDALLRRPDPERPFATGRARRAAIAVTLALALTGALDGSLTFPGQPSAMILRAVHVTAFALWLGGAVWNIFVAVPSARETLAIPVVVAAAEQLERFRWVVRVILPTLALTGLIQALPYGAAYPASLVATLFGRLILVKVGLVVGLVVVFITCPLWRACSPIRGMCDLEDLGTRHPEPARRIDNRGRGCAGFVRIQQALDGMQPGETLELLSSDPISWWELPAWLEKHGQRLLQREKRGRLWWRSFRFLIEKAPVMEEAPAPEEAPVALASAGQGAGPSGWRAS